MMKILFKAALLALSLSLLLSLLSCAKKEEEKKTISTVTEEKNTTPMYETYDHAETIELLYKTDTWLGLGESGTLEGKGIYKSVILKNEKDLDPYREYFFGLSAEDEKKIFADEKGRVVLIELTADSDYTLYSTASIEKIGSNIMVLLNKEEANEPMESHTFFLLYFSGEFYDGETIQVTF